MSPSEKKELDIKAEMLCGCHDGVWFIEYNYPYATVKCNGGLMMEIGPNHNIKDVCKH